MQHKVKAKKSVRRKVDEGIKPAVGFGADDDLQMLALPPIKPAKSRKRPLHRFLVSCSHCCYTGVTSSRAESPGVLDCPKCHQHALRPS